MTDSKQTDENLDANTSVKEDRRQAKEDARLSGGLRGQRARGWTEKLLTRTTSGVIYAVVIVASLYWGPIPTTVLVACMSWLCCSEFFRIVRWSGRMPNEIIGLTAATLFPVATLLDSQLLNLLILMLLMTTSCWYVATPRANIGDVAATVFGPLYTGLMLSAVVSLRIADAGPTGALLTFGAMGSIWFNDACAYLVGSRLGRHKLAPKISPNKSVEGLIGGITGSILVWVLVSLLGTMSIPMPLALCCGLTSGIAGVIGDLMESRIKRGAGVKDSGNFMPGHGGLLDRSDSMIFGCMTAYFVLRLGGIL